MTSHLNQSLREKLSLVGQYRRVSLFPILAFIITTLLISIVLHPIISIEQHFTELTWQQNAAIIALFLIYFYLVNVVLCFFNVATTISLHHAINKISQPQLAYGFRKACQRGLVIFMWTTIASTIGIVIRIIEGWSDHWKEVAWVNHYLCGQDWQTACYFVPTMIAFNDNNLRQALIQSSQQAKKLGGKDAINQLKQALPSILKLPAFIPLLIGIYIMGKPAIIIGAVITVLLLLFITATNSLIRSLTAILCAQITY